MAVTRGRFLVILATLMAACAENGPPPRPNIEGSSAVELAHTDKGEVEDFFAIMGRCGDILAHSPFSDGLLETILSNLSLDLEPPYDETAILVLSLGPVGYVDDFELMSVTSPTIDAAFRLLVEAPPLFPVAPRDLRACVGSERFTFVVKVFQNYQCLAQEEYLAYRQTVENMLYKILYSPHYSGTPGHGWVRFDAELGSLGQVRGLELRSRSNDLASAKLRAAIRQVGTFPPPPDFSRCFAEKPLVLRVEVQGE